MFDNGEPELVNVLDFLREHGLDETKALQVVLHVLLTRTHTFASEAREAASELDIHIPYILPDDGGIH